MFVTILDLFVFVLCVGVVISLYVMFRNMSRERLTKRFIIHNMYDVSPLHGITYQGVTVMLDEDGSRSPKPADYDPDELDAMITANYRAAELYSWFWPIMLPLSSHRIRQKLEISQLQFEFHTEVSEELQEDVETPEYDAAPLEDNIDEVSTYVADATGVTDETVVIPQVDVESQSPREDLKGEQNQGTSSDNLADAVPEDTTVLGAEDSKVLEPVMAANGNTPAQVPSAEAPTVVMEPVKIDAETDAHAALTDEPIDDPDTIDVNTPDGLRRWLDETASLTAKIRENYLLEAKAMEVQRTLNLQEEIEAERNRGFFK